MLGIGDSLQKRYEIEGHLGSGGMGSVYLAGDRRLGGRPVAVKEMDPRNLPAQDRPWAVQAFQQEAQMLARLKHPRLANVSDFFEERGYWYLVMEYVEGETLAAALRRAGAFSERQVLAWAEQMTDVLRYLHHQQPPIIFRDLKPSNVMVQPEGGLKLIDFGIARFFKPGQTADTVRLGTPGYAAPEQFGRGQTDVRSDIYSLGVITHQLLSGYDPAQTPMNLPPLERLRPDVSPRVAAAVAQATSVNPAARFASVGAFVRAMRGGPEQPVTPPPTYGAPRSAAGEREGCLANPALRGFLTALGIGFLLLLLVGGWYFFVRDGAEPTGEIGGTEVPGSIAGDSSGVAGVEETAVVEATEEGAATATADPATAGAPGAATATMRPTPTLLPTDTPTTEASAEVIFRPELSTEREQQAVSALPRTRPNQPTLFAYYAPRGIVVDGGLGEWQSRGYAIGGVVYGGENWSGSADLAGELQLGWDENYLYLALQVQDDRFVQVATGRLLYLGDSVEVALDRQLAADFEQGSFNSDDMQIGLSPGDFGGRPPEIYVWLPAEEERALPGAQISARATSAGYSLEAALPWASLGVTPADGAGYGFTVCLSDNDRPGELEQESMLCVHDSRRRVQADSLGTLVLLGS